MEGQREGGMEGRREGGREGERDFQRAVLLTPCLSMRGLTSVTMTI